MNLCKFADRSIEEFDTWLKENHPEHKLTVYEWPMRSLANWDEPLLEHMEEAGFIERVCYTGRGYRSGRSVSGLQGKTAREVDLCLHGSSSL